jgi:tetratricopeptide (TPR) repeat protein
VGYGNHALFTAVAQSKIWKQWEKDGNHAADLVEPHVELYAHSDVLQNFAESGIVGLAGYILFWAWFFWSAWELYRRFGASQDGPGRLALGMIALGVAFWVSSLVNFPWKVLGSLQMCWLAYAFLCRAEESALVQAANGQDAAACKPGFFASPRPEPGPRPAWFKPAFAALGVVCFVLAMQPFKWFAASIFMRRGNNGKAAQNPVFAITNYEKAYRCGHNGTQRIENYLYLGSMYNEVGKPDKALEWFNRGVAIYPAFVEAQYNTGYTYMMLYQSGKNTADRDRAEACFQKVLDINPRYINALNNLGNIYFEKRELEQALQAYQTLLKYKPETYEAQYNLASTFMLLQDMDKAKECLAKTLQLKPDYEPAKIWLQKLNSLPKGMKIRFQ